MSVYKAINAVQSELSKTGITKDRTNTQGSGYKFRGIDDVYNAIAPLLAKHGLCILPRVLARTCDERTSKSGGALFYVTVEAEFDFVCAEDGSKHTVKTFGEAMDSSDKATNKAMSAAYKYAAFQAFSIPTESDNDADGNTHEVKGKVIKQPALAGIGDDLPQDWKTYLEDTALLVVELVSRGEIQNANFEMHKEPLDDTQQLYLERFLDSKTRAALRKFNAPTQS
tara:strand:+ start:4730 stop:5407 length:678 start_codon:yes stop_codon:yes gene_type:complete